jgi:hypothetical protein
MRLSLAWQQWQTLVGLTGVAHSMHQVATYGGNCKLAVLLKGFAAVSVAAQASGLSKTAAAPEGRQLQQTAANK